MIGAQCWKGGLAGWFASWEIDVRLINSNLYSSCLVPFSVNVLNLFICSTLFILKDCHVLKSHVPSKC